MIIDSSALVAIVLEEPECDKFIERIAKANRPMMSVISYVEVALRLDGLQGGLDPQLDSIVARLQIELVPVDAQQARAARIAAVEYGRNKPARLNFGDCLTYALAKTTGEPLLFKGDDFGKTDLLLVDA